MIWSVEGVWSVIATLLEDVNNIHSHHHASVWATWVHALDLYYSYFYYGQWRMQELGQGLLGYCVCAQRAQNV